MNEIAKNISISFQKIPEIFISINDKVLSQIKKKNISLQPPWKKIPTNYVFFLFVKKGNNIM